MNDARPGANYTPAIFDVRDVDEARRIILTAEAGTTTDERWAKETPWLAERILDRFPLTDRHVVIDFGCGLGRMAKVLIERTRCWVVGVDMSQGMRQLAPGYVQSGKFAAVSPPMLDLMIARGFRAELAIAIWVLQHVAEPDADVRRLQRVLVPGGGAVRRQQPAPGGAHRSRLGARRGRHRGIACAQFRACVARHAAA